MTELQREVTEWAQATFGQQTPQGKVSHLWEELQEVFNEVPGGAYKLYEEIADCMLITMNLASALGVELPEIQDSTLHDVCLAKFEICQERKWAAPDANGAVKHIKAGDYLAD